MNNKAFMALGWLVVLISALFIHTHGIVPYDGGWFVYAGWRWLQGELPFRDFQFVYHPGGIYLVGASLFLGKSLLATRLLMILNTLLMSGLLWQFGVRLKLSSFANFLMVLAFVWWGPGHINFVWPVMLCIMASWISVLSLDLAFEVQKNNAMKAMRWLFLSGLATGLVVLLKQNFGVAILLASSLYVWLRWWYQSDSKRQQVHFSIQLVGAWIVGLALIGLIQLMYLLTTGTLQIFLQEMWFITFERIVGQGVFNSPLPWEYPAAWWKQVVKIGLYTSPLVINAVAVAVLLRRKKWLIFHLSLLALAFFMFSFRPTTDYVHLTPLVAMSVPILAALARVLSELFVNSKSYRFIPNGLHVRWITEFTLVVLLGLGMLSALFLPYYKWHAPLIGHTTFVHHPRVRIWVEQKVADELNGLLGYFENKELSGNDLYVYSFSPFLYFLLDQENPTRYDYVHPGVITDQLEIETIAILAESNTRYVISDVDLRKELTHISSYVREQYRLDTTYGRYQVWVRVTE